MPNTQSFTFTDVDGKILPLVTDGKYKKVIATTEFESALLDRRPVVIYINPYDKTKFVVYNQYSYDDQASFDAVVGDIFMYRF